MKKTIFTLVFLLLPLATYSSETDGIIDDISKYARVCHDESCTSYGRINFKPTINGSTPGATAISITDSGIIGHAWGDEIGWINMSPTGAGVTLDSETGALGGMAYANTGGWINFSPTGAGVTINTEGEFTGWAWISGAYGGWIRFDCGNVATCVKTDWRPESARASDTANSGSIAHNSEAVATVTPESSGEEALPQEGSDIFLDQSPDTSVEENVQNDVVADPLFEEAIVPTQKIPTKILHTPYYQDISLSYLWGSNTPSPERPDCVFCLVVRTDDSVNGRQSLLKWNFIPSSFEFGIQITETAMTPRTSFAVDATSIAVTGLALCGIAWLVLRGIFLFV